MNRVIAIGALLFLALMSCRPKTVSIPTTGAEATTDDKEVVREVRQRFEELVAAAKTLDGELYMSFIDASFSGLRADGTVYHSHESFRADYVGQTASIKEYVSLEFSRIKITPIGPETAVLVNEFEARVRLRDDTEVSAGGGGVQVWSKKSGRWLLVSVSSSAKPN